MTETPNHPWKSFLADFENYLNQESFESDAENLFHPIRYMMSLGGKRVRPVLSLMSYQLFGDDTPSVLPSAMGIELFHNFTLIHDDIMDEAEIRRGKPSVVHKYGISTAILSGDMMMILANQYLQKGNQTNQHKVMELFNTTGQEVCEGQQFDMDFEQKENVSIAEYMRMIELKTAKLLAASCGIGGLRAGASEKDSQAIYDFGLELGLAFQIQDDFLDVYADQSKFGKKIGGDIVQGKKTFLMLTAQNSSKGDRLNEALQLQDPEEKVSQVRAIYDQLEMKTLCQQEISKHHDRARASLDSIDATNERKAPLHSVMQELLIRET